MDAALGPAGEYRVGVTVLDELGRFADRVRPCRARRHDCEVGATDPELDRELATRRVDEHIRKEVRGDAVRAAVTQDLVLAHELVEAADAATDDDPDPLRVVAVDACVAERLLGGAEREEDVAVEALRLLRRGDRARVEVLHLTGDLHREPGRLEGLDVVDAAAPGNRGFPRRRRVVTQWRNDPDPCDGNSLHVLDSVRRRNGFYGFAQASFSPDGGRARR